MEDLDRDIDEAAIDLLSSKSYQRNDYNPLELEEEEFRQHYRLSKGAFRTLLQQLQGKLKHEPRGSPLDCEKKLCMFLKIVASNCFQLDVAKEFSVNQSTASRIFHEILDIIFNIRSQYIYWPEQDELKQIENRFYGKIGIPGIAGCLDGTLVKIQAPTENEKEYVCRKGFHAINCSAVCDDRFLFRWVSAEYPGSAADCRVFDESLLKFKLETKELHGILLADSAYRPSEYILPPILHPKNTREEHYSEAVCRGRVAIEQSFGHLKRQFSILHSEIRYDPKTACKIFVVCCVLRNICNIEGDPLFADENDAVVSSMLDDGGGDSNALHPLTSLQNNIIQKYF